MRTVLVLRWALAGVALSACGGVEQSDLFGGSGPADGSVDAPADVATPLDVARIDVVVSTVDAGHEASSLPDVLTADDPGHIVTPETGPPQRVVSFACPTGGQNICTGDAPIACCIGTGIAGTGLLQSGTCEVPPTPAKCASSGGSLVMCSGSADCIAGESCCGTKDAMNHYSTVVCRPQCTGDEVQFCTGDPEVCMDGNHCVQSTLLPTYDVCNPS